MGIRSTEARLVALALLAGAFALPRCAARAQTPASPYPSMAPVARYMMARADEIALARSAATAGVSADAEVMVLGSAGYVTAVTGHNGFVCIVERSWAKNLDSPDFWNPRIRSPNCFNAAAARSVLPDYLRITQWVMAGSTMPELRQRWHAALRARASRDPEVGAMCYMLSRNGYLGDDAGGPWHPHLMFYEPRRVADTWGAADPHSPVGAVVVGDSAVVTFLVPVARWSDGTPDSSATH